jgi:hypothetical protein
VSKLGIGPYADMTPQDERDAFRNLRLGTNIAQRLLNACPDSPADILAVLTMAVGTILAGFDDEAKREVMAGKIKDGALHFARSTDL